MQIRTNGNKQCSGGMQTFLLLCALGIKLLHHAA
jgi:hypothetical protein